MSNRSFGDLLLGMIVGGLVGYAAALLYAPKSGEETREMLNEKSRELRDKAQNKLHDTRTLVEQKVTQTVDRAKEMQAQVKDQGQGLVQEKRSEVSETLHRVADKVDPTTGENTTPSI